jgi:hypothetical protein
MKKSKIKERIVGSNLENIKESESETSESDLYSSSDNKMGVSNTLKEKSIEIM